jgi:hypothetical protein
LKEAQWKNIYHNGQANQILYHHQGQSNTTGISIMANLKASYISIKDKERIHLQIMAKTHYLQSQLPKVLYLQDDLGYQEFPIRVASFCISKV